MRQATLFSLSSVTFFNDPIGTWGVPHHNTYVAGLVGLVLCVFVVCHSTGQTFADWSVFYREPVPY